jgi:hypothetical protein
VVGYIARRGGGDGLVIAERSLASLELALRSHPSDRGT